MYQNACQDKPRSSAEIECPAWVPTDLQTAYQKLRSKEEMRKSEPRAALVSLAHLYNDAS